MCSLRKRQLLSGRLSGEELKGRERLKLRRIGAEERGEVGAAAPSRLGEDSALSGQKLVGVGGEGALPASAVAARHLAVEPKDSDGLHGVSLTDGAEGLPV